MSLQHKLELYYNKVFIRFTKLEEFLNNQHAILVKILLSTAPGPLLSMMSEFIPQVVTPPGWDIETSVVLAALVMSYMLAVLALVAIVIYRRALVMTTHLTSLLTLLAYEYRLTKLLAKEGEKELPIPPLTMEEMLHEKIGGLIYQFWIFLYVYIPSAAFYLIYNYFYHKLEEDIPLEKEIGEIYYFLREALSSHTVFLLIIVTIILQYVLIIILQNSKCKDKREIISITGIFITGVGFASIIYAFSTYILPMFSHLNTKFRVLIPILISLLEGGLLSYLLMLVIGNVILRKTLVPLKIAIERFKRECWDKYQRKVVCDDEAPQGESEDKKKEGFKVKIERILAHLKRIPAFLSYLMGVEPFPCELKKCNGKIDSKMRCFTMNVEDP